MEGAGAMLNYFNVFSLCFGRVAHSGNLLFLAVIELCHKKEEPL